jgi:NADH dehydrogenase FAD-containing subunit
MASATPTATATIPELNFKPSSFPPPEKVPLKKSLQKKALFLKIVGYAIRLYYEHLSRSARNSLRVRFAKPIRVPTSSSTSPDGKPSQDGDEESLAGSPSSPSTGDGIHNIVILGASFAGFFAARLIADQLAPYLLPSNSPPNIKGYRIIIVEPHTHLHFTWVLPRFSVVAGHEDKAFIPMNRYLAEYEADGRVSFVHARAEKVEEGRVKLDNGEVLGYEYLLICTGQGPPKGLKGVDGPVAAMAPGKAVGTQGLPSRVAADDKETATVLLQGLQAQIKAADRIVVVGGGAAGVELATDAAQLYPAKQISLVHSRSAVMNRFGVELQTAALNALVDLGVDVILNERVVGQSKTGASTTITLSSGRLLTTDLLINCAGASPTTSYLSAYPDLMTPDGYVTISPTTTVLSSKGTTPLPRVFAAGDVVDASSFGVVNPNARSAMRQATIAADNISRLALSSLTNPSEPLDRVKLREYQPHFAEAVIKLTLGLDKSVTCYGVGDTELHFQAKEPDLELMCASSWSHWGVTPYVDGVFDEALANRRIGSAGDGVGGIENGGAEGIKDMVVETVVQKADAAQV